MNSETLSLADALALVENVAKEKFPHISPEILQDFADLLTSMAGESKVLAIRDLTNAMSNLSMALQEGDPALLSQPRGLRTNRVVDVAEFVESKFFMGQRGYVRPKVLEKLWELFHGEHNEDTFEVVLGGGIGWGKSFFGEMALGYMLYKLSCFYSPQVEYGLAPGSSIYFVMQSVKEDLAKKVLFGQFSQRLRRSEYFCKFFPYDTSITSELRFPNNIGVIPLSSSDTSALGLNVFGGILDELAFMNRVTKSTQTRFTGEQEYDQAAKLHSTIIRRMRSRFNVKGRVPGKLLLISSANYPGDFIDRKIHQAQEEREKYGHSTIFVVRMAQWESLPKDRLSEETFLVEVGNDTRSSRIIKDKSYAIDPESVIEVPIDYRSDFESDLEAAIRDLAGIPVGGTSVFIRKRETIELGATTHDELFNKQQLFTEPAIDLTIYADRLEQLINEDYLDQLSVDTLTFYASVDLALTGDSCGLAISHFAGLKRVGKSTNWDENLRKYIESVSGEEPMVIIDGILEIIPPQIDEIDINLIGDLLEILNARINLEIVTADSFQSAALLQRMRKLTNRTGRRIRSGILSVDTTIAPYCEVKQALRDQRLIYPNVSKTKKELKELIFDPKRQKIDHPVEGSKDTADALAATTYIAVRRNSKNTHKSGVGRSVLSSSDDNKILDTTSRPRTSRISRGSHSNRSRIT